MIKQRNPSILNLYLSTLLHVFYLYSQEKLLSQNQWRDYVSHPPPYNDVMMRNDAFEHDDPKGWGGSGRYHPQERQMRANTHSLPRGSGGHGGPPPHHGPPHQAYPMGYASYDRRSGGGFGPRAHHSGGAGDFPPDHYFMPSQRKYAGEELRVYVDYNK